MGYNIHNGNVLTITVAVSDDDANTFAVPAGTFTGDIGSGIAPGIGNRIAWDAGVDAPGVNGSNYYVKITANDGQASGETAIGPDGAPMVLIPAGEFEMGMRLTEENLVNARCIQSNWMPFTWMCMR